MKNKIKLILVLLITIMSCQKDDNPNDNPTNEINTVDFKKNLKAEFTSEISAIVSNDEINIKYFTSKLNGIENPDAIVYEFNDKKVSIEFNKTKDTLLIYDDSSDIILRLIKTEDNIVIEKIKLNETEESFQVISKSISKVSSNKSSSDKALNEDGIINDFIETTKRWVEEYTSFGKLNLFIEETDKLISDLGDDAKSLINSVKEGSTKAENALKELGNKTIEEYNNFSIKETETFKYLQKQWWEYRQQDCNGDIGGSAFIDNCNECVEGNTGKSECAEDCNGDFGGTAILDNCNECVGGNTGKDECVEDCNGDFGGVAYQDNCNECVGGNTGKDECIQDCNGDFGGTAYLDNCNDCVGGNTGKDECFSDCNGDFGGTAYLDNCNECVGGNTGKSECEFQLTGVWHMKYYDNDTRTSTSTTQIEEIDFKNIRESLNISNSYSDYVGLIMRRYNGGWTTVTDPYEYSEFWKQRYVASGDYISVTNTYWTNLEFRFYVNEDNLNILIGESIGLSNNGLSMEMIKQ